jgi:hypothetical protein
MATFLELCQQVHEECGVGGTISTVVGQTGMLRRIVNWVVKADMKIQSRKSNWKFLWAEWEVELIEGFSEYKPPDDISMFNEKSFWKDVGTDDAVHMKFVKYDDYRDSLRQQYTENDESEYVVLKPNGKLLFVPAPDTGDAGKYVSSEYWRSPIRLVNNNQVSVIPVQFHDLIVSQAKVYHAEYRHDTGAYNAAYIEHETRYPDLKAHSLPGQEDQNKSESTQPMTITVI